MQGAGIAKEIGPVGPVTEYAIREIAKVSPEKRQGVFTCDFHKLISGAKVVASLDNETSTKVEVTETAIRELKKVPEAKCSDSEGFGKHASHFTTRQCLTNKR